MRFWLVIFDPIETWKKTKFKAGTFKLREILEPVFENGLCVYKGQAPVIELRERCRKELDTLWEETRRFENPHQVYVDLSDKLYKIKSELLEEMSGVI